MSSGKERALARARGGVDDVSDDGDPTVDQRDEQLRRTVENILGGGVGF